MQAGRCGLELWEEQDSKRVSSTYDLAGQRVTVTHPALGTSPQRMLGRRLDGLGRTTDLFDGPPLDATCGEPLSPPSCILHQDFFGRRMKLRKYANGTLTAFGHDADRLPVLINHLDPSGGTFLNFSVPRNGDHDKTASIEGTDHVPDRSFAHDSVHRLVTVTDLPMRPVRSYALEAAGSRTQVTGGDALLNQYTTTPLDARTYLANGNLLQAVSTQDGDAWSYAWGPLDELVSIDHQDVGQGPASQGRTLFNYDGLGRRILKSVILDGFGIDCVRYYYDGDRVIAAESWLGERRYVPGDRGLDDVVRMDIVGSGAFWLHGDDQLSVYAVTDGAGQVVTA